MHFQAFFNWVENIGNHDLPTFECGLKIHPMNVNVTVDLSATWKFLMRGDVCNVEIFPCHCCSVKSSELAHFKIEDDRCDQ